MKYDKLIAKNGIADILNKTNEVNKRKLQELGIGIADGKSVLDVINKLSNAEEDEVGLSKEELIMDLEEIINSNPLVSDNYGTDYFMISDELLKNIIEKLR